MCLPMKMKPNRLIVRSARTYYRERVGCFFAGDEQTHHAVGGGDRPEFAGEGGEEVGGCGGGGLVETIHFREGLGVYCIWLIEQEHTIKYLKLELRGRESQI